MEYSAWVLPTTDVKYVLPKYTNLKSIHVELLRTGKQSDPKVLKESSSAVEIGNDTNGEPIYGNGKFLNNSSVYDLHPAEFGGFIGNNETIAWMAQNYTMYVDIASQGDEIKDMLATGRLNSTVTEIVNYTKKINAVGIECNLENYALVLTNEQLIQFYSTLGNALRSAGKKLRITVQPMPEKQADGSWFIPDYNKFLISVPFDEVTIMIYDEMFAQNLYNNTSMPNCSFEFIRKNIEQIKSYGIPVNKIVAGIPTIGYICPSSNVTQATHIQTPQLYAPYAPQIAQMTQRDPNSGELFNKNAKVLKAGESLKNIPSTDGHIWWCDHEAVKQKMNVAKELGITKFASWVAHKYMSWFEPVTWDNPVPTTYNSAGTTQGTTNTQGTSIGTRLNKGEHFFKGSYMGTTDGYKLMLQQSGNLEFINPSGTKVWESGTTDGNHLILESTGELILYNSANIAVWRSTIKGNHFMFEPTYPGRIFLYDSNNIVVFAIVDSTLTCPEGYTPENITKICRKNPDIYIMSGSEYVTPDMLITQDVTKAAKFWPGGIGTNIYTGKEFIQENWDHPGYYFVNDGTIKKPATQVDNTVYIVNEQGNRLNYNLQVVSNTSLEGAKFWPGGIGRNVYKEGDILLPNPDHPGYYYVTTPAQPPAEEMYITSTRQSVLYYVTPSGVLTPNKQEGAKFYPNNIGTNIYEEGDIIKENPNYPGYYYVEKKPIQTINKTINKPIEYTLDIEQISPFYGIFLGASLGVALTYMRKNMYFDKKD